MLMPGWVEILPHPGNKWPYSRGEDSRSKGRTVTLTLINTGDPEG